MSEDEYKAIIATYQKKAFELFNQNIVYETQIANLNKTINELSSQIKILKDKHIKNDETY